MCALILALFELTGNPVLQYWYYANFLMASMFLAIGAQLAPFTDRLSSRTFVIVVCGAIAILVLQYRFPPSIPFTSWVGSHVWWLMFGFALTGMTLLFLKRGLAKTLALSFLALGFVNVSNDYIRVADPSLPKQGFMAIVQSVQAIRSVTPSGDLLFGISRMNRWEISIAR